jgi:hypothetical protein
MLKYQISSKSVQWEVTCYMRTGGHDEANSRSSTQEIGVKMWIGFSQPLEDYYPMVEFRELGDEHSVSLTADIFIFG